MKMITVQMTVIHLESKTFFVMIHDEIINNENFLGDEDISGEILLKGDIVNEDNF